MKKIFISGISAKSSGGKNILTNFLHNITNESVQFQVEVLVPDVRIYSVFQKTKLKIFSAKFLSKSILLPLVHRFYLPFIIYKNHYDLVVNFADIPIATSTKQIFLFDWAFAVYRESIAWDRMGRFDKIRSLVKIELFEAWLCYIDVVIVQTNTIRKRFVDKYGFPRIEVVPNSFLSFDKLDEVESGFFFGTGLNLLCLTRYYPHKNLEVLIDLAALIKLHNLNWKIILTIDRGHSKGAELFIKDIERQGLFDVFFNIGEVDHELLPSLYHAVDALLLPTLLESFSSTYVEAMYYNVPIFTSDLDFSREICRDAAFYFNPIDAQDIYMSIDNGFIDSESIKSKVNSGKNRMDHFLFKKPSFDTFMKIILDEL